MQRATVFLAVALMATTNPLPGAADYVRITGFSGVAIARPDAEADGHCADPLRPVRIDLDYPSPSVWGPELGSNVTVRRGTDVMIVPVPQFGAFPTGPQLNVSGQITGCLSDSAFQFENARIVLEGTAMGYAIDLDETFQSLHDEVSAEISLLYETAVFSTAESYDRFLDNDFQAQLADLGMTDHTRIGVFQLLIEPFSWALPALQEGEAAFEARISLRLHFHLVDGGL